MLKGGYIGDSTGDMKGDIEFTQHESFLKLDTLQGASRQKGNKWLLVEIGLCKLIVAIGSILFGTDAYERTRP